MVFSYQTVLKSVLKGRVEPAFMGANKRTHNSDRGTYFYGTSGCSTPFSRLEEPKKGFPLPRMLQGSGRGVHVYKGVVIRVVKFCNNSCLFIQLKYLCSKQELFLSVLHEHHQLHSRCKNSSGNRKYGRNVV